MDPYTYKPFIIIQERREEIKQERSTDESKQGKMEDSVLKDVKNITSSCEKKIDEFKVSCV